jgi:proteic killer suppression protein
LPLIASFKNRQTEEFWREGKGHRLPANLRRIAMRKLKILNDAQVLEDLRTPPGNRLEALRGSRAGQHSVRINDQFRVCFRWVEGKACEVEIVDYH